MLTILSYSDFQKQWNEKEDIEHVILDLNENENCVETLQLSGNTLGVAAANQLTEPLSSQSKLKKLLWNDLFTGRLKAEIGIALKSLSLGLMNAQVQLVELDLSDNAFGPNGVVGVTDLLSSPCCYTLKTLNMNNQGLGHQGCRYLIDALKTSRNNSNKQGMNLEVFIAGRNRLENVGMKMLTEVFGDGMSSLKKLVLLQNGIGIHGVEGVENLILSLKNHINLKVLNISDNTIKANGMKRLCKIIPYFENLEELHMGDCLIGNSGLKILTKIVPELSKGIRVICIPGNEVTDRSAREFVSSLAETCINLEKIDMTENEMKKSCQMEIKDILQEFEKENCWVDEDDNSDDDYDNSDENKDDTDGSQDYSNEHSDSDDYSSYETSSNSSEVERTDEELEPEPEIPQTTKPANVFCFGKHNSSSSSLFSKNPIDTGNLFGPTTTPKKELVNGNAREDLFNIKTNQTNIFKANSSNTEPAFLFGPASTSKNFSFLSAAKTTVVATDEERLGARKSIMSALMSDRVMVIDTCLDKAVVSNFLDAELLEMAEQNPENAVRLGMVLCNRSDSFAVGANLISHVLASTKSWARATNSVLAEMDCIKNEEHGFIPLCKQYSKLPIRVLSHVLDKGSAISKEVRINLTTVLKNLNKISNDETEDLLKQLEGCLDSLKF